MGDTGKQRTDGEKSDALLEETFYILSKKNTVFKVRLTEKGLCLRKESNGATTKEQTIALTDIIGCRCMRSRRRNTGASCVCTQRPKSSDSLRVVDENSVEGDENDVSAYLYIYAYVLKRRRRGAASTRERTTITLRFRSFDKYEDNNKEAQRWRYTVKCLVRGVSITSNIDSVDTRKILILLNPKSGPGKAREFFQNRVSPILAEAEVAFDLQVTKRANFAREFVRVKDVFQWRAIVAVGGDGIYFEVVNGLFERSDWERAVEALAVGVVPCGSGNGLARTICHLYNEPYSPKPVLGAALAVVKGKSAPMDLVRVETTNKIMYSFLSVGWGLLSDIDIESESLRALGGQRFTLWSLARLIGLRTYRGTVAYLPASREMMEKKGLDMERRECWDNARNAYTPSATIPTLQHNLSQSLSQSFASDTHCQACGGSSCGDCELCDSGFGDALSLDTGAPPVHTLGGTLGVTQGVAEEQPPQRQRLDSWYSTASRRSAYYSAAGVSLYKSVASSDSLSNPAEVVMNGPASRIPALTARVPDDWVVVSGEFVMVHASYQAFIGSDCCIAPKSTLNDGIIWLLVIKGGTTRAQLLAFLLGLSSGTHIHEGTKDSIQMIPVTAFRITPEGTYGHITVDGENVEYGPIQGEVFPSLVKVMVP